MRQYKETITPGFSVILKHFVFFYAAPCIILLPILVKVVVGSFLNIPHASDGLLSLYVRCYTSSFLFFIIPVLFFLFWVSYSNTIVSIVIKNDRLFLPIQTGVHNAGQVLTIIPLADIVSLERKQHHPSHPYGSHDKNQDKELSKKFVLKCYKGYQGDWAIVKFIRPKKGIARFFASLEGNSRSYDTEDIYIEFPTENFDLIESIIG